MLKAGVHLECGEPQVLVGTHWALVAGALWSGAGLGKACRGVASRTLGLCQPA